jgi:hypothetical protein
MMIGGSIGVVIASLGFAIGDVRQLRAITGVA